MDIRRTLESDLGYVRKLGEAGWNGIASSRHEIEPSKMVVWTPAMIGAGVGMLTLIGKRKRASSVAFGGVLGGIAGFGAGFVWGSRGFMANATRTAVRRINAARDARWLEKNPITYA